MRNSITIFHLKRLCCLHGQHVGEITTNLLIVKNRVGLSRFRAFVHILTIKIQGIQNNICQTSGRRVDFHRLPSDRCATRLANRLIFIDVQQPIGRHGANHSNLSFERSPTGPLLRSRLIGDRRTHIRTGERKPDLFGYRLIRNRASQVIAVAARNGDASHRYKKEQQSHGYARSPFLILSATLIDHHLQFTLA